mgnify:CR=1 FL=1
MQRIALYSPGMVGLGHIRRNLLIAETITRTMSKAATLVIGEARQAGNFTIAANVDTLTLPKLGHGGRSNPAAAELYRRRTVFDNGEALETPRYSREKLLADDTISGPALVIQHNSTTIVPPDYVATVMDYGDMLIRRM